MNPLTLVKRIQNINSKEAALGISEQASWHVKYKESAYVYVGGIPFDLTEGDLLAVFAQYGEIVDVNLVRDKGTGKSKGFAFIAYEDQRSTILAVDNLNGAQILGRIVRVDHVSNYKKKEEEDEEAEQQKREARGVCRAFQRGECTRGASCRFSHNEQRAANTGWGAKDQRGSSWGHDKKEEEDEEAEQQKREARGVCRAFQRGECTRGASCKFSHNELRAANTGWGAEDQRDSSWGHDKFDRSTRMEKRPVQSNRVQDSAGDEQPRLTDIDTRSSRVVMKDEERGKQSEPSSRYYDNRGLGKGVLGKEERERSNKNQDKRGSEMRSTRHEVESKPSEDREREEKRSRKHESESESRRREEREREKDYSSYRRRGTDEDNRHRLRR